VQSGLRFDTGVALRRQPMQIAAPSKATDNAIIPKSKVDRTAELIERKG
jgi:hypothetical protein